MGWGRDGLDGWPGLWLSYLRPTRVRVWVACARTHTPAHARTRPHTHSTRQCKRMTKQQRGSTDRTYPLGIVAMNIALLLVDILSIKRQRFQSTTVG